MRYIPRAASIQFNFYSQTDPLAGISTGQTRYTSKRKGERKRERRMTQKERKKERERFDTDIIYGFRTLSFPSSSRIIPSLPLSMSRLWPKLRFRPAHVSTCDPLSTLLAFLFDEGPNRTIIHRAPFNTRSDERSASLLEIRTLACIQVERSTSS